MQRNFKMRNDFNSLMPNAMAIIRWTVMVTMAMVLQQIKITDAAKFKGESCTTKNQPGICREWSECPVIKSLIESGQYTNREVVNCGFTAREELICCPIVNTNIDTGNTPGTNTDKDGFVVPTTTPRANNNAERPAARACRRIEKGLIAGLTVHILGGTPADRGEFPHMVGLGYRPIGGDGRAQLDFRCGGTLIDKRFVLTAAHCVSELNNVPSIVRLGVVDFNDAEQMSSAVELKIKETYIHDNYTSRLSYNDIAILELEREVETNEYIYPTCLYMTEADPDPKVKLWVTGWGTVNMTTRSTSDILLKAPVHTTPLENCNSRIVEYGLTRKIPEGIIRTQFCAEDKDQVKDACQGDSGGPLNLVVDESLRNYRLVGIVSTGFGCASSTPGLYTRVAAYLDFIERIVWPNGGD